MASTHGHSHQNGADGRNACCEPQAKKNQQHVGNHKPYTYAKIARKRGAIRILKLYPSNPQNPDVECELIESGTDGIEKYEALSWCWGKEQKENFINIRQKNKIYVKKVQPNLFEALKALRYRTKDRYLWVDAVCIDQENLEEKNHQVEMMFEIYGKASKVCIWLGTANDSSCLALRFIENEVLHLKDFDRLCEQRDASEKWEALLELMQRPWFSRRWVVQEIALAQEATVYCGEHSIGWRDFAVAVELFVEVETATHRLSEVMRKDSRDKHVPGLFEYVSALGASLLVDATDRLFRDFKQEHQISEEKDKHEDEDVDSDSDNDEDVANLTPNGSENKPEKSTVVAKNQMRPLLSLEYLVSSLTIFDTTMPHDTIYALLAIAKDTTPQAASRHTDDHRSTDYVRQGLEVFTQRKRYNVNYDLPYVDVCREFIEFAIARSMQVDPSRALDVICRPWATNQKMLNATKVQQEKEHQRKISDMKKERVESQRRPIHRGSSFGSRRDSAQPQDQGEESKKLQGEIESYEAKKKEDMELPSWVPQLSGAPFGMYQQAGITGLKMSRKNADPLVGLPSTTHKIYAAAETKKVDTKTLKFRKRSDPELNHYSMYVRGFELDSIERVEQASLNGQIPREWAELAGWEDAKGKPPEAFWRTLVADRGKDGKNPPVYYSKACAESFNKGGYQSGAVNTADLIYWERNSVVSQFCRRVQAVIWNRALVKTRKGRFGLVDKDVKEGDLVCIFYGLSVPVVLRKSSMKEPSVYQKELEWEANFLVNMVYSCWKDVKARRHQHELRKRAEMATLIRQWLKKSKWFRNNILTLQGPVDPESDQDLIRDALKAFDDFRVENRKKAWPPIATRLEKERRATLARKQGSAESSKVNGHSKEVETTQPSRASTGISTGRPAQSTSAKEEDYGFVHETLKDGTNTRKRLVDWWEFEYQLKAFRRWKEIIKERKERRVEEWRDIMNMVEQMKKKNDFERFCVWRQRNGWHEYTDNEKCFTDDEQSYAIDYQKQTQAGSLGSSRVSYTIQKDSQTRYMQTVVTVELLEKMLAQKKLEQAHLYQEGNGDISGPSYAGTAGLHDTGDGHTISGAQELFDSDDAMASSVATLLPSRVDTSAATFETNPRLPVRPSWIKPPQREAMQKAREKSKERDRNHNEIKKLQKRVKTTFFSQEEPKKKERTPEDIRNQEKAMQDLKEALKERYGDDGWYSYKMLGECYIHGMMDGEAMLLQNEGDPTDKEHTGHIPSVVFEIR
ncbi:HET-domain-containing protein [Paraphaeosphaeria sporulosa]|uniref:HET-domain-containing protein n=1 Tax=Paraphaeosphaeria sporulosa TaxID=1460663 RepID=A0A177CBP5_9PLEO|nr:HET-domain-containing protein [Paraphaeosphaeria sporulosa]OAG04197.1 HET-domain-containing protein [Paraphaeosphaeria sporulosa]